ncbi:MAG: DEAD/DEAH box helicase family protein [Polyangiaceae bacterium]
MYEETRRHLAAGCTGVLNIAPTGSGKGDMITDWLRRTAGWGRRALFAVHLEEIALDVRDRLAAAGVPSRVLLGHHDPGAEDSPVTIASWQTLHAREVALPVDLFIQDEAHRAKAATCLAVLARHHVARRLGFTATGQRGDGSGLGDAGYQVIVQGPQVGELVAAGHLAPCRVLAPDAFSEALADDPAEVWVREAAGAPGLVFASSLSHSRAIAEALRARGVRALHVDSDTPSEQRTWAVLALEDGSLDVICNFRLFVEGVNVRRAAVVMLASAFSHDGPYLQSIGRGRRVHASKPLCLVLDLRGNIHRRGHPDLDREYSLTGVACRPVEALTAVVCCKSCLSWQRPFRTCRECGAALPPPKPPRVSKKELREQRLARVPRSGDAWERWVQLVETQRDRGYKPQWAAIQWHQTTGAWPRFTVAMVPERPGAAAGAA